MSRPALGRAYLRLTLELQAFLGFKSVAGAEGGGPCSWCPPNSPLPHGAKRDTDIGAPWIPRRPSGAPPSPHALSQEARADGRALHGFISGRDRLAVVEVSRGLWEEGRSCPPAT